jgi:lysophospholipase L1-like esterase
VTATLRTAYAALAVTLATLVAACGGGFGSAPSSPPDTTIRTYVALGDDFTAAPGIGKTAAGEGCQRSDSNYPTLLADELEVEDLRDVSCVEATTASLTSDSKPANGGDPLPPQLDAVDSDADLVTIAMGLRDRDLITRVFRVCLAAPCGTRVPPQTLLSDIGAMAASLTSAVRAVQDKATHAYIVLVGYPKFTPDEGPCDALPELEQPALDAANRLLDEVNRETRSAARDTGVGFLDVARLSTGHELCSGEPWVEAGNSKRGQASGYHPVEAEQRAVAQALATLVRNH